MYIFVKKTDFLTPNSIYLQKKFHLIEGIIFILELLQ